MENDSNLLDGIPLALPAAPIASSLKNHGKAGQEKGFTLVELLVVTVIIGILSTLAIKTWPAIVIQMRITRACNELRNLEKDIVAFNLEKGYYPHSLAEVGRDSSKDPWGNSYVYVNHNDHLEQARTYLGHRLNPDPNDPTEALGLHDSFDLFSMGADRQTPASPDLEDPSGLASDDIVRTGNGQWIGLASGYM